MPVTPRLAAWLDSYPQDLKAALRTAARTGFACIAANTNRKDFDPRDFGESARRHLRRYLRDLGLTLDQVVAAFPGAGLADPSRADERVAQLRQTLQLAADLGVPTAGVTLAGLGDERRRDLAAEMLALAAELAEGFEKPLAVFSTDPPEDVAPRLRRLGSPRLKLGLDTAALAGAGLHLPPGLVAAVHLRDVRRMGQTMEEVPFGQGDVDFAALLGGLAESEYAGTLTIRRDVAGRPVDALRQGREYVEALLGRAGGR